MSNPEKIALLTDSSADLSPALLAGKAIYVVPEKIICADGEYDDGVTITPQDVYTRLRGGERLRTSLPDGGSISNAFDAIKADGYDKVIAITISGALSGTYNMMRLMAQERADLEVVVFDSHSGSMGVGMVVLQLWEELVAGASWHTLVKERTPFLIDNTYVLFSLDTLEYLRRGGRIGLVTAMAGSLLNIKPILGFAPDGQLTTVAKVRGRRGLQDKLVGILVDRLGQQNRPYNIAIANGGAPEEMATLAQAMRGALPHHKNLWAGEIDATLSVYIGDGILGSAIQFLE